MTLTKPLQWYHSPFDLICTVYTVQTWTFKGAENYGLSSMTYLFLLIRLSTYLRVKN
jgi:hypothetical protein